MPSPASHLRAPLLWLLVPLMAGLVAGRTSAASNVSMGSCVALAGAAAIAALVSAAAPGRVAGLVWAAGLSVAVGLSGCVLVQSRFPVSPANPARPPREVTLTIEARQTFALGPTGRQFSGLATIIGAGAGDDEAVGRLVYYSAIRRISVPPQRTGRYVIRGVLEPLPRGPAADDFTDYLANLGVSHRLTRARITREVAPPGAFAAFCARAHSRLETLLRRGLTEQPATASTYVAMLLGGKTALTADQQSAYMRSGTFHVFSISGLHVGVIASALLMAGGLFRIPRRWLEAGGLPLLWLYVEVTGASAPAMRSFLMIAAMAVARSTRLPGNPLAALAGAACVTLLLDPMQLFSTGFQMSYSVVLALFAMGLPLGREWAAAWQPFALLPRGDWRRYHHWINDRGRQLLSTFAVCWTAFLASTPSGIGYFQLFSPGSLVANLVIIPLSMAVIYAGFISLLAGLIGLSWVCVACNLGAAWTVNVMDWLLRHGTSLPAMWFPACFRTPWLAPVSLAVMTAVFLFGVGTRWSPRYGGFWTPAVALALLMIFGAKFD